MPRQPPRTLEWIATLLIPPACREEVLGDLEERCASPWGYSKDALIAIPCLIASRVRRSVDPPVLLLEAMVAYLSFLVAAWIVDGRPPVDGRELSRLAALSGAVVAGAILSEVYAKPGALSPLKPVRGPALGVGLAFLFEIAWSKAFSVFIPFPVTLYGSVIVLTLASATNLLLPPVTLRLRGANVPALWLKHAAVAGNALKIAGILAGIALIVSSARRFEAIQIAAVIAAALVVRHVLRRT